MSRHVLIAFTNCVAGREDEFNEWYTKRHMVDVLSCPGFVSGQRFRMSSAQRSEPPPYEYMALYELMTDNLQETLAKMLERVGTEAMPMSDALQSKRVVWTYFPITPPMACTPASSEAAPIVR